MQSKITAVVLGIVCVWLVLIVTAAEVRYMATRSSLDAVGDRIASAQRENSRISDELERMKQPGWLALLARARLNFKKPDETVVFVYKSEKAGTLVQPQQARSSERTNPMKWADWLRRVRAGLPAEAP